MKITAFCGITAPDPKGVSYNYAPGDTGNCDDAHAKYLIAEGFAERASKDAELTAKLAPNRQLLPKGVAKANAKPGKATAVKRPVPPAPKPTPAKLAKEAAVGPTDKQAAKSKRQQARADLLGDGDELPPDERG